MDFLASSSRASYRLASYLEVASASYLVVLEIPGLVEEIPRYESYSLAQVLTKTKVE